MGRAMGKTSMHTARRIVVRSLVLSAVGIVMALLALTIPILEERAADARAVIEVDGVITRTGLGEGDDVAEVTWRDRAGASHTSRFTFGYPEEWPTGTTFPVRYDPDAPSGRIFAAPGFDDYLISRLDGLVLGLAGALLVVIVFAGAWCARGLLTRSARGAPVSSWQAVPMIGVSKRAAAAVIVLVPPERSVNVDPLDDEGMVMPDGARWQRVYWDPALDRIPPGEVVSAQISSRVTRRAVVELSDGTRIWPAGRLRRRPHWGWTYAPRQSAFRRPYEELRARAISGDPEASRDFERIIRADFDLPPDQQIDPADADYDLVDRPVGRLWPDPKLTLVLMAVGAFTGWRFGGLPLAPVAGAGPFLTLMAFFWGWYGGEPERP
jgi:uncharacterized protein DUF3592